MKSKDDDKDETENAEPDGRDEAERASKSDSDSDVEAPNKTTSGLAVAVWGVLIFVGCRVIEVFLEAQSMAGYVGQAVLVEWAASRLGVPWSPAGSVMTTGLIARRIAIGVGVGVTVALTLFGILVLSGGAAVERAAHAEAAVLAIGFATAAILAWRDEVLFHGVTLRAIDGMTNGGAAPLHKVLACGLTSAGAALGRSDATPKTVIAAALLGILFGTLWVRDRGAWQPWAAHMAFRWTTGTILAGGIVHHRLAANAWAGGDTGMLGGTAATVALMPLAVLALVYTVRRISPSTTAIS